MSKNPKNEQSAKQQAIAARHDKAYQLLEAGVKHSAVVGVIQRQFNVGRSTAFTTVQNAQIQLEDHQRHSTEMPEDQGIDPQEVAALLTLQLREAALLMATPRQWCRSPRRWTGCAVGQLTARPQLIRSSRSLVTIPSTSSRVRMTRRSCLLAFGSGDSKVRSDLSSLSKRGLHLKGVLRGLM